MSTDKLEGGMSHSHSRKWGGGCFIPHWASLLQLNPILADIEYLQDQHLLLTVKSMDGYESYGEGGGALRGTGSRAGP